jgi:hypothetical protein
MLQKMTKRVRRARNWRVEIESAGRLRTVIEPR